MGRPLYAGKTCRRWLIRIEFQEKSSIVDLQEDAEVKFQALVDSKWTLVGDLSIYQVGDGSWHIHGRLPEKTASDIQQFVTDTRTTDLKVHTKQSAT